MGRGWEVSVGFVVHRSAPREREGQAKLGHKSYHSECYYCCCVSNFEAFLDCRDGDRAFAREESLAGGNKSRNKEQTIAP